MKLKYILLSACVVVATAVMAQFTIGGFNAADIDRIVFQGEGEDYQIIIEPKTSEAVVIPIVHGMGDENTVLLLERFVDSRVILNETFGTPPTSQPFPFLADFTGFSRTGAGADAVTYTAEGGTVSVRGNAVSFNYTGASGAGNAMMAATGASLIVNNIATCGATTLNLSFGSNVASSILSVAYRINGTATWVEIPYDKDTDTWDLVSNISINLPAGTNTINLKFTAAETMWAARVDDINITSNDTLSTPIIDPDGDTPLPSAIFLETFGDTAPTTNPRPTIAEYTGYDNAAPIVFTGNTDVRATLGLNSAGYYSHIWFAANSDRNLTISGINTEGASDLKLSFDLAHNALATPFPAADVMTVTVKDVNTGVVTPLTIPETALGVANTFLTISDITGIPATSNLEITFQTSQTTGNTMGIRLDNVRIDGAKP